MQALLHIARVVRRNGLDLTAADVDAARAAGATDGDVQLAVLIASAFSMYNRMVDGLRAMTAPSPEAYRERAGDDRGARLQRGAAGLGPDARGRPASLALSASRRGPGPGIVDACSRPGVLTSALPTCIMPIG